MQRNINSKNLLIKLMYSTLFKDTKNGKQKMFAYGTAAKPEQMLFTKHFGIQYGKRLFVVTFILPNRLSTTDFRYQ